MIKQRKGITLIALVVTIIVLLILAGISITMITGQNGILNRAQEAKNKTETSQEDENQKIQGYENIISQYAENLPKGEGTTPYLPNSTFSYKEGNLSTGLVIEDKNNNEYVWVEVPKIAEVYSTAGTNITSFTTEEYTKIEADLKKYTKDYKNDSYSDTNSNFTAQYQNMLKSVYTNGGFWIGRYEAGLEEGKNARTEYAKITDNDKAVVKPNMYPYNYVTRDEAQELATKMNYEGCTSSLIYGLQWDLVLKYIESKNATAKSNLVNDSTTIGNYYNAEITLNRGKFGQYGAMSNWYNFNSEEKKDLVTGSKKQKQTSDANAILLTTGATDIACLQKIYDIAGNEWEWTLEFYNDDRPCVLRGGGYHSSGLDITAMNRANGVTGDCASYVGFRIGLWK